MSGLIRDNKLIKIIYQKIKWNLEPVGLLFLLVSFGWQCLEEHSNSAVYEGYIYQINEKLDAIWNASYDEYVHSERYREENMKRGNDISLFWYNYDIACQEIFKDWNETKKDLCLVESQRDLQWKYRICLYILGSIMIVMSKIKMQ